MKQPKHPPAAWDGKKPLKFRWVLWLGGNRYPEGSIVAYNVEEKWFDTQQGRVTSAPFLIQRITK